MATRRRANCLTAVGIALLAGSLGFGALVLWAASGTPSGSGETLLILPWVFGGLGIASVAGLVLAVIGVCLSIGKRGGP